MYPDLKFNVHFLVYPSSFYIVQYKAVKTVRNTEFSTKTRGIERAQQTGRSTAHTEDLNWVISYIKCLTLG